MSSTQEALVLSAYTVAAESGACKRPFCGTSVAPQRLRRGEPRAYCSDTCRRKHWEALHPRQALPAPRQSALPGESRVERAFTAWIDTAPGRHVEAEVARLAREDKAAGDRRGEINLYLALVRRSSRHLTLDAQGYRCNNSHRAMLARRLMERPELAGFFEIRDLRGRVA